MPDVQTPPGSPATASSISSLAATPSPAAADPNQTQKAAPAQPDPSTLRPAPAPAVITKARKYSLLKAVGMVMQDPNAGDIGLERELHVELSRGKSFKGAAIPYGAFLTKSSWPG